MKIRFDFVTNSSSSSFICCFARIADQQKAQTILNKFPDIELYSGEEVLEAMQNSRWYDWLEYDWAGINVTPSKSYIEGHLKDKFVVMRDAFDIEECWEEGPNYDIDFEDFSQQTQETVNSISEENGFAEIKCQFGAGRDG